MTTSKTFSISVILPAFNEATFIAAAIESVLAQSLPPQEIIVIDDGSSDETARIVSRYASHVHFVSQPNRGVSAARNHGISIATAEFLAFIDADDLWPSHKLAALAAVLANTSDADIVLGRSRCFKTIKENGGEIAGDVQLSAGFLEKLTENISDDEVVVDDGERVLSQPFHCYLFGAALIRSTLFQTIGPINETYDHGEDLTWFLRAREAGARIITSDVVSLFYQRRPGTLSAKGKSEIGLLRALKGSLERRRKLGENSATSLPHTQFFGAVSDAN